VWTATNAVWVLANGPRRHGNFEAGLTSTLLEQSLPRFLDYLIDTKVSHDTFVHLFAARPSGVIALSSRSHPDRSYLMGPRFGVLQGALKVG